MPNKLIPLTLEQHQQILYEILYMVDDFCKAHDIPYFLVGGTLLGAARHKGIIPWDDDIDIAMIREHYDRFIELFYAEGVEGYELFDYRHTDGYLRSFAMMSKSNTWTSFWATHKINIDIFPYDGCDDDLEKAQIYFTNSRLRVARFMYSVGKSFPLFDKGYSCWRKTKYLIRHFLPAVSRYYPIWILGQSPRSFLGQMHQSFTRYKVSDKKYSANIVNGEYGIGEVQLSTSFLHLDKMKFGSRELPVPSGWHDYLTGIYGDYMTIPPEYKRKGHFKDATYLIAQTEE